MDNNDLSLLWCKQYIDKRLNGTGNVDTSIKPGSVGTAELADGGVTAEKLASDVFLKIYPIGSIYISAAATNPKELFGFGEWVQIKDRFILAAGDTYAAGSTGGEAAHTLTEEELPFIDGRAMFPVFGGHGKYCDGHMYATGGIGSNATGAPSSGTTWPTTYGYGFKFGGGAAHNNMPPYQAFYVWMRVS